MRPGPAGRNLAPRRRSIRPHEISIATTISQQWYYHRNLANPWRRPYHRAVPASRPAHSPRARLLAVGKTLFARVGYEQASTSTIAREAGTSESQLARCFGGKAGLLEAVFNEGWKPLTEAILRLVADAPDSRTAIVGSLTAVLTAFRRDPELACIFLFEGRRVRGERHEVALSSGFREFSGIVGRLIRRGQQDGAISRDLDDAAVASALMGAAEEMIREWVLAKRAGEAPPFPERAIQGVFAALVAGLASPASSSRPAKTTRGSSARGR